ncbi:hypothetical protein SAMN04488490_3985 [Marinobacter sp. LV10R510-11A]|nr:hypothetical protein SAMN04488490_3985 [Marinobacter sp. LV10R510-11A]
MRSITDSYYYGFRRLKQEPAPRPYLFMAIPVPGKVVPLALLAGKLLLRGLLPG